MKTKEMREKRAKLIEQARNLVDATEAEDRYLTAEEQEQYDGWMAEAENLGERMERGQRLQLMEANLKESEGRQIVPDAEIGMSDGEIRQYSLVRAIRAQAAAQRGDHRAWNGAELERDASAAVEERLGRTPQGFFVPWDVQRGEQRDLVVGTDSAGGYTVATELLGLIDLLRNKMSVRAAGATVLSGLEGDIAIPRQSAGATAYWVAESGAPTEGAQTFEQIAMAPKTVGAFTDISRKLLLQSSIDVEAFVRNDLATVLAIAIDLAALHGTGASNQPTGIAATSGIGSVAGGTNGLAPTWDHVVNLETEVAVDNADIGRLAYMTNAKVRGKLKKTLVTATYGDMHVWPVNATSINGYPVQVTNQVSSTLDKGTSTGVCSAIFFGNWADLLIGFWSGLDILVDPYTGGTAGTVRVIALQDTDIAVRHPESFAAMLDALTA